MNDKNLLQIEIDNSLRNKDIISKIGELAKDFNTNNGEKLQANPNRQETLIILSDTYVY